MSRFPSHIPIDDALPLRLYDAESRTAFATQVAALGLTDELGDTFETVYAPLALWIADQVRSESRHPAAPLVVGISGAQGSGKSTAGKLIAATLRAGLALNVALLSIDDLYLTRAKRRHLAQRVHPLLLTRGVPGTHDVDLGLALLRALDTAGSVDEIRLPSFDKSTDDRRQESAWLTQVGRPDVVLFEGWCVGMVPQPAAALRLPINELERTHDADGRWRRHVNECLKQDYAMLFARLDRLIMLQVPSMRQVFEWRELQERQLIARVGRTAETMDPERLRTFVMHYERLTRHALEEMPARADLRLEIGDDHQIAAIHGRT